VWLAAVNPGRRAAHSAGSWLGNGPDEPEALVSWFTVGHLAIIVFAQDFGEGPPYSSASGVPLRRVRPKGLLAPELVPIWPSNLPVVAWPRQPISEDRVAEIETILLRDLEVVR
jgi:hypothetical protein